jgi:hypothetical protein
MGEILNNANPKNNPFSTVIGLLLLLPSLWFLYSVYVYDYRQPLNYWFLYTSSGIGVLLIFAKDEAIKVIIKGISAFISKFLGNGEDKKSN